MVKLFQKNDTAIKFLETIKNAKNINQGYDLYQCTKDIYSSFFYGDILYNSSAIKDLVLNFSYDFFTSNYNDLINSYINCSTYEQIIFLIKKSLGDGTIINFVNIAPCHLQINIQYPTDKVKAKTQDDKLILAKNESIDKELEFNAIKSEYTINQTISMIESIKPASYLYEYDFSPQ